MAIFTPWPTSTTHTRGRARFDLGPAARRGHDGEDEEGLYMFGGHGERPRSETSDGRSIGG
jgi:hypothetical protein